MGTTQVISKSLTFLGLFWFLLPKTPLREDIAKIKQMLEGKRYANPGNESHLIVISMHWCVFSQNGAPPTTCRNFSYQ